MDSNGRAAIREMKALGRLGPLMWPVALLDGVLNLGLGQGYVWRAKGRVVGNVSMYLGGQHPDLGRGALVANVAVHPDYRRKGIATTLMEAVVERIRKLGGNWVMLQVEADNEGAITLYERGNFVGYEIMQFWRAASMHTLPHEEPDPLWQPRPREMRDVDAEIDLIYRRARVGAMTFTRPLTLRDARGGMMSMGAYERYVLPDPTNPDRLVGSLWIEATSYRRARMSLFVDPAITDPAGRLALLRHVLTLNAVQGRALRLEAAAGDELIEQTLERAGFRRTRTLLQMRRALT